MGREIWYLIGRLGFGGAEQTLVDIANGVNKTSYDVSVCTIAGPNPLAEGLDESVTHRRFGNGSKFNPIPSTQFITAHQRDPPDILQSFLPFDNFLARIGNLLLPDTIVITGLRSVPKNPNPLLELVDQWMLPLSDCIISNSKAGRNYLMEKGAAPSIVEVIYNGRIIDDYYDIEVDPGILSGHKLEVSDQIVGTVGRLIKRKGHYDLIEAWPHVLSKVPEAQLIIVGDGPERKGLEQYAAELGCSASIHFLGMRDDVPQLLAIFDVFAFPSHFEGLPGALLEAMASELPIICTPVDGNSELVRHYHSGLHVDPYAPDQLGRGLVRLLIDQPLADELAETAHNRAVSKFSHQQMVNSFTELYDELS